jgi:hypothetical protein
MGMTRHKAQKSAGLESLGGLFDVTGKMYKRATILCKVKVKLSLCFNWAPRHESVLGAYWGSGSIAPRIIDFGTRWGGQLHAPAALLSG